MSNAGSNSWLRARDATWGRPSWLLPGCGDGVSLLGELGLRVTARWSMNVRIAYDIGQRYYFYCTTISHVFTSQSIKMHLSLAWIQCSLFSYYFQHACRYALGICHPGCDVNENTERTGSQASDVWLKGWLCLNPTRPSNQSCGE